MFFLWLIGCKSSCFHQNYWKKPNALEPNLLLKFSWKCKRIIKSDDTTNQQINKKAVTAKTERVKITEAAV